MYNSRMANLSPLLTDNRPWMGPPRGCPPRCSPCRRTSATAIGQTTGSTTRLGTTSCTCPALRSRWRQALFTPAGGGATRRTRWTRRSAPSASVPERAASPGPSESPCSITPATKLSTKTRS
jgi:hypothetical protein